MLNLLYVFLTIVILKLLINITRYRKCSRYLDRYHEWLADPTWELAEHRGQVIDLLKHANVEDHMTANVRLLGLGYVGTGEASCFRHFPTQDADMA